MNRILLFILKKNLTIPWMGGIVTQCIGVTSSLRNNSLNEIHVERLISSESWSLDKPYTDRSDRGRSCVSNHGNRSTSDQLSRAGGYHKGYIWHLLVSLVPTEKEKRGRGCNVQLCVDMTCKMISIMFQPLHDQRSNAYSGKDRRRIPGLSKAQRRIKASSTPALLDRDVERWVVIFESVFIIHSISWGSYSPHWILSTNVLGSRRTISLESSFSWSFRCNLPLASFRA